LLSAFRKGQGNCGSPSCKAAGGTAVEKPYLVFGDGISIKNAGCRGTVCKEK
jgi:hypothetical protein